METTYDNCLGYLLHRAREAQAKVPREAMAAMEQVSKGANKDDLKTTVRGLAASLARVSEWSKEERIWLRDALVVSICKLVGIDSWEQYMNALRDTFGEELTNDNVSEMVNTFGKVVGDVLGFWKSGVASKAGKKRTRKKQAKADQ